MEAHSPKGKPPASQLVQATLTPHPHANQQLFSDHYLDVVLLSPARPDWLELTAEAEPVLRDLQTEQAVTRLIAITQVNQETREDLPDWLQVEFEVQEPGRKLENFAELDSQVFVEEVRKRRPASAKK